MAYLFAIFNADRKLCREICRLPLLWMHPCERQVEKIHKILIQTIGLFNISDTDYGFVYCLKWIVNSIFSLLGNDHLT